MLEILVIGFIGISFACFAAIFLFLIAVVSLIPALFIKQKKNKAVRQEVEDFIRNNHELFNKLVCENDEDITKSN